MPWSQSLHNQFARIPADALENAYHGPYNKILYTLFPGDPFTVVPHFEQASSTQTADFLITVDVMYEDKPVLILELKRRSELGLISKRASADDQIRLRMADLSPNCPLPVLHAISAFGPMLSFYTMPPGGVITPARIPRDPVHVNDVAPVQRWNLDVMDAAGEARLRQVVDWIKEECANLEGVQA